MKKWFNITGLLPAVAVGMVAVLGFQTTVPTLTKVVWPEEPEITVEAKEKTDKKAYTADKDEDNNTEKGVGNYTDGTFTGVGVGYGGKTRVSVTVASKQITSIDVLSNNDTPSFFNRAKNIVVEEILTAQTWEVDSVSGATYSSRGIKEAVCNAITGEESQSAEPEKAAAPKLTASQSFTMGALKDGVYTGSARGFGGMIKVSVTIVGGKITSIKVLSHSGETASYYNKATAIIKRILKKQSPNVDTVSGATYSSTGIREAVKKALKKASGKSTTADEKEDTTDTTNTTENNQPEVTVPAGTPADGTYTGTSTCVQAGRFDYQVTVSATYKDGKLVDITYTTTDDGDNESYISRAWNGMKQELLADQSGNVDAVSRATYTSNALKTAYKLAYKQAVEANGGQVSDPDTDTASTDTTQKAEETTATTEKKPETDGGSSDSGSADIKGTPADGSYKVSTKVDSYDTKKAAYGGAFVDYTLTGTVIFKDGKLTAISGLAIGDEPDEYEYEDDQYYLDKASSKVISSLISKQSSDVDTVSGATCSSKGIIRLYEAALKEAVEKNKAAADSTEAATATTATTEDTTATTAATETQTATSETVTATSKTSADNAAVSATEAAKDEDSKASDDKKSDDKKSDDKKSDDKKSEDKKNDDSDKKSEDKKDDDSDKKSDDKKNDDSDKKSEDKKNDDSDKKSDDKSDDKSEVKKKDDAKPQDDAAAVTTEKKDKETE